ncbi:zinc-binding dehydrogenase [Frigidibacter albus]|uniref:Zinc-binding dehydrogenase n=1 Tax=Frigidibacter albus TaxID=1465486 RepID=A0A6L8VPK4_9RHOB|nr:NADPH:quinone oxidoreductase family protein [Frigidibacter albus]MZQ91100.1 zinc-binding dehydrogenase [Frigidibacter albus]NBE32985.1 zinc-binding dehydrogenase [Frigidibacter albus]
MKAMVCIEQSAMPVLNCHEMSDPVPGPGQALIELRATSLSFPDVLTMGGQYQRKASFPHVPGIESSGVVLALGPGTTGPAPGTHVSVSSHSGGFAERIAIGVERLTPLPEGMSFEEGAVFFLRFGTAWHALVQRGRIKAGEKLLVLGAASGVGLCAVELGRALGAEVTACASDAARVAIAAEAGAQRTLVYPRDMSDRATARSLTEALREAEPGGYDLIFDPVGGGYAEAAYRAIAPEGRHLVVGFAASEKVPALPLNLPLLRSADVVGVIWGPARWRRPGWNEEATRELTRLWIEGRIRARGLDVRTMGEANVGIGDMRNRRIRGTALVFTQEGWPPSEGAMA